VTFQQHAGLSLSACRQWNLPAEKDMFANWILSCDHLVKGNELSLGYARTIT